ncbi:hypothetical protein KJ806_03410 [Patescibacteria group bacterium]|nr:hypothetical protein [Patescibacteria group bacterium]
MSNIIKRILILSCLIVILILPYFVFAENTVLTTLKNTGKSTSYQVESLSLSGTIGTIVGIVLSLLGVVFLILTVYAGFNWMTAAGEEERVTKAKETLTRAVIGLIITLGSYAIWAFVSSALL